jgi:uncharacterized membrane protein
MFENIVFEILYYIIWVIEIVGIVVIVFGTFYSLFKELLSKKKNQKELAKESNPSMKMILSNFLTLGLDYLLAAEILKTVTINRELSEIVILGAIIILRAAMSLLIYWELSYEDKKETFIEKKKSRNSVKPL